MYKYRVKEIKRIIDGDTVDIVIDLGFGVSCTHRIRLKNVDAPETRTLDFDEKRKGLQSKEWLTRELTNEKRWIIETTKEDKYGRFLGVLFEEGSEVSLNQKLIDDGMASPYLPDR